MRAWAVLVMAAVVVGAALVTVSAGSGRAASEAKWLVLVYLDADNSLDVNAGPHHVPVVQSDLDELMSVGSTPDVAVYALVDRYASRDALYRVDPGHLVEQTSFALEGQEFDMGAPATLRAFVAYASSASPAEHILLVFWDHGSPEYVAYDEHAAASGGTDHLTHQEVIQALEGYHVDVVAADECLVAQLEVAYEYATRGLDADYLVAAETYTGWEGFPYDATLHDLVSAPGMSARDVAVMMVDETAAYINGTPPGGQEVNAHAAIDLPKVPALGASVLRLASALESDMKANAALASKARGNAQFSYGANALNLVDLKTFVLRIAVGATSPTVYAAAVQVAADVDAAVIALQATKTTDHQITGLGIAFPNHAKEVPSYYAEFAFPAAGWMDFLEAYWAASGAV